MKMGESAIRAGIVAIIIIAVIGAYLIYSFNQPPEEEIVENQQVPAARPLQITSIDELKRLISQSEARGFPPMVFSPLVKGEVMAGAPGGAMPEIPAMGAEGYSSTNVQVEGIDEADIVKTDGDYIYYSRGRDVVIVDPTSLEIIARVEAEGYISGIYLYDGLLITIEAGVRPLEGIVPWPETEVSIKAYNISDITRPRLVYSSRLSGNYLSSRLYNGYLYVVTTEPAYIVKGEPVRPLLEERPLPPERIIYLGGDARSYTTLFAIDLRTFEDSAEALLSSSASRIYMSYDSLYITSYEFYMPFNQLFKEVMEVYFEYLPDDLTRLVSSVMESSLSEWTKVSIIQNILADHFSSLDENERVEIANQIKPKLEEILKGRPMEMTSIFRFSLNGLESKLVANATVPGNVLEQFAMDERNDTFRIATTSTKVTAINVDEGNPAYFWPETEPSTGLYILDKETLEIVGSVEGLAPGERMYAARYVGEAAFLVTFRRVDPLFAIDLSDPANPKVIGYTKIPGYSEYLHPYGDYLLGIGPDADEEGRVKGLKISLFDVSDLEEVREVDVLRTESSYAGSEVFYDYHAFLAGDGWFAIPVNEEGRSYLWVISVQDGNLDELAKLEHRGVKRGLYINDTIYTISESGIKAFEWGSWNEIKSMFFEKEQQKSIIDVEGFSYHIEGNDLKIKVTFRLPNPCYSAEPGRIDVGDGSIVLHALVREPPKGTVCAQVITMQEVSYSIEKPPEGEYELNLVVVLEPSGSTVSFYLGDIEIEG